MASVRSLAPSFSRMCLRCTFTVSTEMPRTVYDLMDLYPQAGNRRPSVQYVPLPYRGPATPPPLPRGNERK